MPEDDDVSRETLVEMQERKAGFALPAPGRERLYGRFDEIPPQASTARNLANRRRVIK